MGSVFISYRRDDAGDVCRALAAALMARLGKRNVFLDVDSISGGELFPRRLEQALRASDLVLVMIGPGWLIAADQAGQRRLDNPADFVRREVELALASGATMLPVLVRGAALPAARELPPTLAPLAALAPLTLRDGPDGTPDLAPADRAIRRAALEAELRRLPRVSSPLLVVLAAAQVVTGVPYVASKALGHPLLDARLDGLNTNIATPLIGWPVIIAAVLMIRGRRWAWLAALVALFVLMALVGNPASYWAEAPVALCIGLFGLTGRRFSLMFAAWRLRHQEA